MSAIPGTWQLTKLEALGSLYCGQSPAAADVNREGNGTPYVTGPEQWDGQKILLHKWTTTPKRVVPDGCIFITVKGAGVGKLFPGVHCAIGRDIYAFHPNESVERRFLELALRFTIDVVIRAAKGDIPGLSKTQIFDHEIGLPPLSEQRRIMTKIEELFSELDEGVANLKKARAQLAVYRQALLKHAFEGHLTADWRSQHTDQLESADQLLARIGKEREERYERELKEWKMAVAVWEKSGSLGRRPSKPSAILAPEVISESELDLLRDIPSEWVWTRVEDLGVVQLGRQRSPKNESKNYPTKYIRAANITEEGLSLGDVKHMEFLPHELENYRLVKGDIVLSEASGSASQVGKPAMWNDQIPDCCFQNTVIRHRPHLADTGSYLLALYKFFYSSGMFARVSGGVGINHLSANKFAAIPVPLAPLAEQERIVSEVDRALSAVSALEADIDLNLQKAEALRQSILKKAFAGELVPQDPADEPASELLARIRAEREAAETAKPRSVHKKPRKEVQV